MSDIGEVLEILSQAQESVKEATGMVATAHEKLAEIGGRLGSMGIQDRAAITYTAAQSTEEANGALAGAVAAVEAAISATHQAGGAG